MCLTNEYEVGGKFGGQDAVAFYFLSSGRDSTGVGITPIRDSLLTLKSRSTSRVNAAHRNCSDLIMIDGTFRKCQCWGFWCFH
jgi:hypothetical protein